MSDAEDDVPALAETWDMELSPPVVFKGATFAVLHLKEPRAQQVRASERKLDATMSLASVDECRMELIRLVAKVDVAVVEAMRVTEIDAAYHFLAGFINDPFKNSEESSGEPDARDLPLDPPISWNGGEVRSLSLREPTGEEMRKAHAFMQSGVSPYTVRCYSMELVTLVTGLHPAVIHGLRIRDLEAAVRHLTRFTNAGQKTGKR